MIVQRQLVAPQGGWPVARDLVLRHRHIADLEGGWQVARLVDNLLAFCVALVFPMCRPHLKSRV